MLQNLKALYGHKLAASDGDIGRVKDFFFDDNTWAIRYLIVDTGSWLTERLVLLSPHALAKLDQYEKTLHVKLHKKQIENSPMIESCEPVSRQHEMEYYRYYGWPAYWVGGARWGIGGNPNNLPPAPEKTKTLLHPLLGAGQHLQSTRAAAGYQIQTDQGVIGTLSSFSVDDRSWMLRELIVETRDWKEILIPSEQIKRIDHDESMVLVNHTKTDAQWTAGKQLTEAWAGKTGTKNFPA